MNDQGFVFSGPDFEKNGTMLVVYPTKVYNIPLGTGDHVPGDVGHGAPGVGVGGGLFAAGLPDGDAGGDALGDGGAAEHVEGLRPAELGLHAGGRRPPVPKRLAVELGGLLARREARRRARSEARVRRQRLGITLPCCCPGWLLGRYRHAIPRAKLLVAEEAYQVLVVRQVSDGHAGLDVLDGGLGCADAGPGAQLPGEEAAVLAKIGQAEVGELHGVQGSEGADGVGPHGAAVGGVEAGQGRVGKDAAVEELHDVKWRADHGGVLAEAVGPRHGQAAVQGGDDAVLALDLVRRPRHQLPRRLLAHHVPTPRPVRQLVRRVRLPVPELLHLERRLDLGHVGPQRVPVYDSRYHAV
ncbi:hypothetical protein PpBr36_00359 [Pyricularia pennisetigena]|uniref:hypothetical protein n=1 Tax=Pyricularia pennisetigena TaxID=1578925 RepID=UPI00115261FD|nr:hypothetical protein PpBr36_00359 [Pyricularia pennisetigena]TLS27879.1 hypothetical protein PpBr36_00359 [Pyricularia pennisetigena]